MSEEQSVEPALRVLWRDAHFVAVDKPSGLLVHRSRLDSHAEDHALQRVRDGLGQWVYPVHRLDRPTSGVLVFALSAQDARALGALFASGAVRKTYLALVRGWPQEAGCIEHALREERDPIADALARADKAPQPAVTDYRRVATAELARPVGRYASARYALVEACPRTGRRHQIRRHLAHIAHPVIGDTTHGDGRHNALAREALGCQRLMLAAVRLEFLHPGTGATIDLRAPVAPEFGAVLEHLGMTPPELYAQHSRP